MASNEHKVLKSNSFEDWRQKTNEVSFDLGDDSLLDDARLGDRVFEYTASANQVRFSGNSLEIQTLPDQTLDNTGGYIILAHSTSIPTSFVNNATVTQSGGYSATIESVVTNDSKTKILVKNSSGDFNTAQGITVGSDTIAAGSVDRIISESFKVGKVRVTRNGGVVPHGLSEGGFHIAPLKADITLANTPSVNKLTEGTIVYQDSSNRTTQATVEANASWYGVVLHANTSNILVKTSVGTFNAGSDLRILGYDLATASVGNADLTSISVKDDSVAHMIEFNNESTNGHAVNVITTTALSAINELQDDIGTVENLTTSAGDLTLAINEHESDIGNMSLTGLTATNLSAAARELRTELGDVTTINNATGYSASDASAGILEIQGDIGNVDSLTPTAGTIVGALNEIEAVFDASQNEISAGSNAFNITSGVFTINSSGDIILDADDADVLLKDNGTTYGSLTNSSDNLLIKSGSTTMLTGNGANATFANNVNVINDLDVDSNLNVDGTAVIDSTLDVGALSTLHSLTVTNGAQLNGGFTVDTNKFTVANGTGDTLIAGTLNVDGAVDIDSTVDVLNGATLRSTLDVSGATGIDGDFDINTNKFTVASGTGNTVIAGTLDIGSLTTTAQTVRLAINELQSEVGSAVFTGDITDGAGSVTSAIGLIEAEIGDDESYNSGTITFGSTTIAGTLVNLNNELDALNALTLTAGDGLSGGGTLESNRSFAVNVDDSSIEINSDTLKVKSGGITNGMLAGSITNAKLAGSIANSKLSNSSITVSVDNDGSNTSDAVSLGQTLAVEMGAGLNGSITSNTLSLSAELASETNAGIATFDGTDFTVTSGDVTVNAERIQDIIGLMVAGNTEDGIVVTYQDTDGTIDFDIDSTVVRTSGDQNIAGNKSVPSGGSLTIDSGATLTVNGTLTIAGSSSGISTFGVDFLETDGGGTSQGLQIKNQTVHSGYSVAPQLFWDHSQVSTDPRKAWKVKGLAADGSTAEVSSLVTYENARSLIASNTESGINVTFDDTNNNFDFNVNDPTISFSGGDVSGSYTMTNLGNVNNVNLTIGASVVENSMLAGSIANNKLSNSSITISDGSNTSPVALGGTLTIQGTSSEVTVSESAGTVTVGLPNDVTIGNDLTVTGDLIVSGDTTTLNTATLDVEDLNITVGKNASTLAATDGAGLTFGASSSKPTLTWDNGDGRLTVNKRLHSSVGFTGDVVGNASTATTLATSRNFSITGDITASNVSFNGSGPVELSASIDANTVGASELKVGANGTSGQVLASDGDGTFSWVTRDNYSSWTAADGASSPTSYPITSSDTLSFVDTSHIEPRFDADDQLKFNLVANSIGAAQLNVTGNGTNGQALLSDGDGTMTWGTIASDNYYVTGATFNTSNGVLTLSRNGGLANVTVDLDGRFSTTDTNTVTRLKGTSGTFQSGDITIAASGAAAVSQSGNTITITSTDTNTTYSVGDGGLTQKNFTTTLKNKLDGIASSANNYSLPLAASGTRGGVKVGYTENGKNYPVELSNEKMYVNVPWTDTTIANTDRFLNSATFDTSNGVLTLGRSGGLANVTVDLDGRYTSNAGTVTSVGITTGTGLDGSATITSAGTVNITLDLSELTDMTGDVSGANDELILLDSSSERRKRIGEIKLGQFNNDQNWNNYSHPSYTQRSVSLNTSGAQVIDTLTITSDNIGSVTDASVTTRDLTKSDIGLPNVVDGAEVNQNTFAKVQSQNGGTNSTLHSADAKQDTFTINAGSGISITDGTDKITLAATIGDAFSNIRTQNSSGTLLHNNNASGSATFSVREGTDISLTQPASGVMQIAYSGSATANSAGTGIDINGSGVVSLSNDHRKGDNISVYNGAGDTYVHYQHGTSGPDLIRWYVDNDEDARLTEGGGFQTRGDVTAFSSSLSSDVKLKDNIQKVEGALELVEQLDGVTWNWKKDGKASAGVVAQNVEKVLPSAVKDVETLDGEEINKHVDYNQLSALFIEAIKELKEENKLLRAEIESLKDINNR